MTRWLIAGSRWWPVAGEAVGALAVGLALARLPLLVACALVGGAGALAAILFEPLIGLGLALIAGPFSALERFTWGLPLDSSQVILLITLGAWLLRGLARREVRIPRAPLTLPLLVFTGVAAFSLWGAISLVDGLKELLKWIEIVAVYWFVVEAVDRQRLPWLIGLVLFAALIQAVIGIWQFGLSDWGPAAFSIPGTPFYRAFGSFHQPNPYAGYLGITLPLAVGLSLSATNRWLSAINFFPLSTLLAAGLVASWSRGAWLGAAAALAVMAAFWPRRWWLGVGLVSIVVALVVGGNALGLLPGVIRARLSDVVQYAQVYDVRGVGVTDANYAVIERLAHWQAAGEMIRWNLWMGVGLGNYEAAYETYRLLNWPQAMGHAHNYLLNITAETGLPGLLAYLFLWGAVFWQTFRVLRSATGWRRGLALGLLGVWVHLHVHNLFDNLYVSNLWIHLAALMGMLTIVEMTRTNDE